MRKELEGLPRMHVCTLNDMQDVYGECYGRVRNPEWHHVWTYAGRQINEWWAILAGCTRHHDMVKTDPAVKAAFETASLLLATEEDLAKYPKAPWDQRKKALGLKRHG